MGLSDTKWQGFVGAGRKITEEEIAVAAKALGVKWSRLHGVMEIEAAFRKPGDGFDKVGRPKMLYEPHKFHAALKVRAPSKLALATAKDLARPSRPPMSWYGKRSYWRLVQALEIEETSALLACSWGFGQVLGSNWKAGGFRSVQDMVRQCMDSEAAHLQAMCGFIRTNKLVGAIQSGNANAFAAGYNGAAGVAAYGPKIRAAWARWERVPFPFHAQVHAELATEAIVPEPKEEAASSAAVPEAKAAGETKRVQGIGVVLLGLIGGAVVKKWFPESGNEFQDFMTNHGGEAVAFLGALWSLWGHSQATTAIAGTPLAKELDRLRAALEAHELAAAGTDDEPAADPSSPVVDLSTAPIEEIVQQLPAFYERLGSLVVSVREAAAVQARLGGPDEERRDVPRLL